MNDHIVLEQVALSPYVHELPSFRKLQFIDPNTGRKFEVFRVIGRIFPEILHNIRVSNTAIRYSVAELVPDGGFTYMKKGIQHIFNLPHEEWTPVWQKPSLALPVIRKFAADHPGYEPTYFDPRPAMDAVWLFTEEEVRLSIALALQSDQWSVSRVEERTTTVAPGIHVLFGAVALWDSLPGTIHLPLRYLARALSPTEKMYVRQDGNRLKVTIKDSAIPGPRSYRLRLHIETTDWKIAREGFFCGPWGTRVNKLFAVSLRDYDGPAGFSEPGNFEDGLVILPDFEAPQGVTDVQVFSRSGNGGVHMISGLAKLDGRPFWFSGQAFSRNLLCYWTPKRSDSLVLEGELILDGYTPIAPGQVPNLARRLKLAANWLCRNANEE